MTERQEELFDEVFNRLRETEAQTREQNVRIDNLCNRLDNITEAFTTNVDAHERRSEARERTMWKVIGFLIGAVVLVVLGPKAASRLADEWFGRMTAMSQPIALPATTSQDKIWYMC